MLNVVYVILALLGLGFLVFIHELGHYWMARRVGMRVEVFSIGFGKPFYTWQWQGVRWQVCWVLFGGYVKIAGMTKVDGIEPCDIPDGFFGKKPWQRIKVALMGPLVNIVFAFVLFTLVWALGGRDRPFYEVTGIIGWVDGKSELYDQGVRPGDVIESYDDREVQNFKDHLFAPIFGSSDGVAVKGDKIDYYTGKATTFSSFVKSYQSGHLDEDLLTLGVLAPARYLIYEGGQRSALMEGSPMVGSGLRAGDRIVWVDGELIFSLDQLSHILNDSRVLLTIRRGDDVLLKRVPRVLMSEFRLRPEQKAEIIDWQFEMKLENKSLGDLLYIPYDLNFDRKVDGRLAFIDADNEHEFFPQHPFSLGEGPLKIGDEIIAVDGTPVQSCHALMKCLQSRKVHILVENDVPIKLSIPWMHADDDFFRDVDMTSLMAMVNAIGTGQLKSEEGNLRLLKPVVPKKILDFDLSPEKRAWLMAEIQERQKQIEKVENVEFRERALREFEESKNRVILGIEGLRDEQVRYNVLPWEICGEIFHETVLLLKSLVVGNLHPKWLSGPVAIVQVMHYGWSISVVEAFFWIATISLSLGLLNLLPVPLLDGGHILLSVIEMITKKPLKAQTLERLVVPFIILIVGAIILVTYYDVSRIIKSLF